MGKSNRSDREALPPSSTLWIGNLTNHDVEEKVLVETFSTFGSIVNVTCFPGRPYAFVCFHRIKDAIVAKHTLQGLPVAGSSAIRIAFARPAKPSKRLIVSGIGPTILRESLEVELYKYGQIEELKILQSNNSAIVEYSKVEDAMSAVKYLNGKSLGFHPIRVDYLRSHSLKGENAENTNLCTLEKRKRTSKSRCSVPMDMPWMHLNNTMHPIVDGPAFDGDLQELCTITQGFKSAGKQEFPSKVLWIGYPTNMKIDEGNLYNTLILFGEIEHIRVYPLESYALVEFRSVLEAERARRGVQGRLFNDPRIRLHYLKGDGVLSSVVQGQPLSNRTLHWSQSLNVSLTDAAQYNTSQSCIPYTSNASNSSGTDHLIHAHSIETDSAIKGNIFQGPEQLPVGHRSSCMPSITASPRNADFNSDEFQREPKRPKHDTDYIFERDFSRSMSKTDGMDSLGYGNNESRSKGVASNSFDSFENHANHDRDTGWSQLGHGFLSSNKSNAVVKFQENRNCKDITDFFFWHGTIEKGGSKVCRVKCAPLNSDTVYAFPEVVNCSARTDLSKLAEHFSQAKEYGLVCFMPERDQDALSYHDFLQYLKCKKRAGVAKFGNGTTLFLVPPSDFCDTFLKVSRPSHLLGVLLFLPRQASIQQKSVNISVDNLAAAKKQESVGGLTKLEIKDEMSACLKTSISGELLSPPSNDGDEIRMVKREQRKEEGDTLLKPDFYSALTSVLPNKHLKEPEEDNDNQYNHVHNQLANDEKLFPQNKTPNFTNHHVNSELSSREKVHFETTGNDLIVGQNSKSSIQTFGDFETQKNQVVSQQKSITVPETVGSLVLYDVKSKYNEFTRNGEEKLQALGSSLFKKGNDISESEAEKNQRYHSTLQFAANLLMQLQGQQGNNGTGRAEL